jgi:hypothetical protein
MGHEILIQILHLSQLIQIHEILRSFDRWGELLVPLELELSSPFGISSNESGSFTEESEKISHGVLYNG